MEDTDVLAAKSVNSHSPLPPKPISDWSGILCRIPNFLSPERNWTHKELCASKEKQRLTDSGFGGKLWPCPSFTAAKTN